MHREPSLSLVRRSLRLIRLEAIVTSGFFAMPILTIFFAEEIGMNLAQVGLSQAIFIITVIVLNIPTGWLADRFSHKWANVIGDLIAAGGFVYYSQATTFSDVVIAEIIVGVGMALTNGVDSSMVESYTKRLGLSYRRIWARIGSLRTAMEIVGVTLGGLIGAHNPRLAIGLSGVMFLIGALLSLGLVDTTTRRAAQQHPLRDMARIVRYALNGHAWLRWSIVSAAIARESTHALVWILTPLLIYVGVPLPLIGAAWAINLGFAILGSEIARRWRRRESDWQILAVSTMVFAVCAGTLSLWPSLITVILYGGFGWLRGWHAGTLQPLIQRHTPDGMKATVSSLAATIGHIVYAPIVWGTGALGDMSPQIALAGSLLLFTPLLALCTHKLYKLEGR